MKTLLLPASGPEAAAPAAESAVRAIDGGRLAEGAENAAADHEFDSVY